MNIKNRMRQVHHVKTTELMKIVMEKEEELHYMLKIDEKHLNMTINEYILQEQKHLALLKEALNLLLDK
jgi:hypothetical protein